MLRITGAPNIITSSDDWNGLVTLWENGAVSDVSAGAVKACLQDSQGRVIVSPLAQSNVAPAAWANGVVNVILPASVMSPIYLRTDVFLEIQVTIAGLTKTWPLFRVDAQTGTIP